MKSLTSTICLLFFFGTTNAQTDITTEFLDYIFQTKTNIYYAENSNKYMIETMHDELKNDTLFNNGFINSKATDPNAKIILSNAEREYVLGKVEALKKFRWEEGQIKNGKVMPKSEINAVYRSSVSKGWKKSLKVWEHIHEKYGPGFYTFSKPILLRNDTLCIFYIDFHCGGLCGNGEFSAYIKQEGEWIKYCVISNWVS